MEEKIRMAVGEALARIGARDIQFVVERPANVSHGDYTTNAALVAAKKLGKNPRAVADELARFLIEALGDDIASHVAAAGPGFVNITLAREAVALAIAEADARSDEWGRSSAGAGQRVIVEYTDPNPFKEMHIGHLMSNIIGESLAQLIGSDDSTVIRANYQGDVGPHVAKALWGLGEDGISEPTTVEEIGAAYAKRSEEPSCR
ncbi:MAG: arginyl-tRNA synthetase, partial [Parcubacteria group bacterium Gr01-1014_91]